jgi:hypothetical protein
MDNMQEVVSSLLNQVSLLVKKMTTDELKGLIAGDITIDLVKKEESKKTLANRNNNSSLENGAIAELLSQLRATDDREQGLSLLRDYGPSKSSLEMIGRKLDIPISQRDNMETLREKIIEATIGYRLRSMAIQGKTDSALSERKPSLDSKTA